jgi:hypothetical protein
MYTFDNDVFILETDILLFMIPPESKMDRRLESRSS